MTHDIGMGDCVTVRTESVGTFTGLIIGYGTPCCGMTYKVLTSAGVRWAYSWDEITRETE